MAKSNEHRAAIEAITLFYIAVGEIATSNLKSDRKLQIFTLLLSTITSGTLWTLIATKYNTLASWIGAAVTTLTTAITIYQSSIGPNRTNIEAQILYEEIGEYLSKLASTLTFDSFEFRDTARRFEAKLRRINYNHPILYSRGVMLGHVSEDPYDTEKFLEKMRKAVNWRSE